MDARHFGLWVLLSIAACGGDESWPCEEGGGVEYDVEVGRFPTRFDMDPLPIADAELCLLDSPCPCLRTNDEGRLRVTLPPRRRLLLEARATGYLPTLTTHVTGDVPRFAQIVLMDRNTAIVLAGAIGERLDASRGHVGIRVAPTADGDVSGTTFTLRDVDTGAEHPFVYVVAGTPDRDATGTDAAGGAVAVNVPPGRYRIESPTFASCALIDSGWPDQDDEGRLLALEAPVAAGSVTLLNVLQCAGR